MRKSSETWLADVVDHAKPSPFHIDFARGTLDDEDATGVDGVYLFNPFFENLSALGLQDTATRFRLGVFRESVGICR